MNKKCKCGGTLQKDKASEDSFCWICPDCGHSVHQRRRRPYKLNAERDIIKVKEYLLLLLKRNPISSDNQEEWRKFTSLLLQEGLIIDKMANKVIIEVVKTKRKKKGE